MTLFLISHIRLVTAVRLIENKNMRGIKATENIDDDDKENLEISEDRVHQLEEHVGPVLTVDVDRRLAELDARHGSPLLEGLVAAVVAREGSFQLVYELLLFRE